MASFMHIGRLEEFLCLESCLRNHAELLDKDKKTVSQAFSYLGVEAQQTRGSVSCW